METYAAQHRPHSFPLQARIALQVAIAALRALVQRLDAGLVRHRQAAADRTALARMSDYELRDIGVSRGSFDASAVFAWGPDSQPY